MNLERGFSVSKEKRDVWAPLTPEKPVIPRPNQVLVRMQQNQIGGENWQDLLGFYTDVMQDESCGLPPSWNPDSHAGVSQRDPTIQNFAPVASLNKVPQNIGPTGAVGQHNVEGVAFVESSDMLLPCSSGAAGLVGMNHWNRDIQDVVPVDKFRGLDQNARNVGSYLLNVGGDVPPRKVNSLAELLGMRSTLNAPTTNPSSITQHSQVERNWNNYITDSMIPPLQNNVLHANQDISSYNLHQIPSSK